MYTKDEIIENIIKIRKEIGHEYVKPEILKIHYNNDTDELTIITPDRPEKSIIIGKGGWVVGKLREKLQINSIHVVSYTDIILKEYQLQLSKNNIEKLIKNKQIPTSYIKVFENIYELLKLKCSHAYDNNIIINYIKKNINRTPYENADVTVALSGGVDSSFSLLLAKALGFNVHAFSVDPGTIILPKQFHYNIDNLVKKTQIQHEYLEVDMKQIIDDALNGKIHPCGRCSSFIEKTIHKKTSNMNIPIMIYGDLLSTGSQAITFNDDIMRINLPALMRMEKNEIKNIVVDYDVKKIKGYGCPLVVQVHHKYPQYRSFSIQRVLRETRAGILEPGEALDLINTI